MSFPLPKLYRHLTILVVFTLVSLTLSISIVLADSKTFTGTLDVDSPTVAVSEICGIDDITRYQLHSAFTVSESGSYSITVDDYEFTSDVDTSDYYFFFADIATDLSMDSDTFLGGYEVYTDDDDNVSAADLVAGEIYYLLTGECGFIEMNIFDSVDYTFSLSGTGTIDLVPAIDRIDDQSFIEGTSRTVDVSVIDDGTVTIGYQVFDKNQNVVPVSDPLYTTVDNGNGTGTMTFTPQVGDSAAAPYDVTVTAQDNDNNITTRTFQVDVVVTESTSYSGTLDDTDPYVVNGDSNIRHQTHGSFTPTADGIYSLSIDDLSLTNPQGDFYYFFVGITQEPSDLSVLYGWVEELDDTERYTFHANLKAGETYYLLTSDGSTIDTNNYDAADYEFTLTGPLDNAPAPVVDPIRHQYVAVEDSLTVDVNTDAYVEFVVYDKDDNYVEFSDPLYDYESNGEGIITFTPEADDLAGSPYTVVVEAYDAYSDDVVLTVTEFLLIVTEAAPPEIEPLYDQIVLEGESRSFNTRAINSDAALTYQVTDKDDTVIPVSDPLFVTVDNGNGTGNITFTPQVGDNLGSPYEVTVTAEENNVTSTETFIVQVPPAIQSYSGTLDNTDLYTEADACVGGSYYQPHGSFTPTVDGLYSLSIPELRYQSSISDPDEVLFSLIITTEENVLIDYRAWTRRAFQEVFHANLRAGETYYISAIDCDGISRFHYTTVDYDFTLYGPSDIISVPVIDPIPDQSVEVDNSLTVDINVSDDNLIPSFEVWTWANDNTIRPINTDFVDFTNNLDGTGSVTYTPQLDDATGSPYRVFIWAFDETGNMSVETFILEVTGAALPPAFDPIADVTLAEGNSQTIQVNTRDSDGDTPTLTMPTAPNFANFVDNGDGTGDLTLSPADGQEGDYTVTLQAADNDGSTSVDIDVTVTANQKPVFDPIADQFIEVGSPVQITANATDPEGQAVSYRLLGQANNLNFVSMVGDTVTIAPTSNDVGTYRIIVEASDGVETKWEIFEITVHSTDNDAPIFDPIGTQIVAVGDVQMVTVNATDPEGQTVSYRIIGIANLPSHITWDGTDTLTIAPTEGDSRAHYVKVEASDGVEQTVMTFAVGIDTPENDQPVFDYVENPTVCLGDVLRVTFTATDPEGQPVTFRQPNNESLPDYIVWNGVDSLTISPQYDDGTLNLSLLMVAFDGVRLRYKPFYIFTEQCGEPPVNQKPVFEEVGDYWIAIGRTQFLPIIATDPEGEDLSYRIIGGVQNLSDFIRFNPTVPRFRIAPRTGDNGTYTIRIEASDGVERRWMTFRVRVVNAPN